jgi:hypothetical protein
VVPRETVVGHECGAIALALATQCFEMDSALSVRQSNLIFLSETCSPTVALFPFVILGEQVRLILNTAVG